jgi:hypothetical protein
MPAPIADWSEVKATAISTGNLQRAAELHGLPYDAVRQRSSREKWPVGHRLQRAVTEAKAAVTAQIVKASEGRVTVVTAADAIASENAENGARSRSAALRYSARNLEHLADLPAEEGVLLAPQAASLVKVAATAGDWDAERGASVSVNVLLQS